ncbi:MAG: hypothetical protein ABI134_05875, partial [Byssovorax sp.]
MRETIAAFFAGHPECRLRALGARDNAAALDLAPFGQTVEYLDAAASPTWVERYHAANRARFPGALELPGWVLVDLYLLPAAIGLLTCPARLCEVRPEGLGDDDEAIAAAYYAAPSVLPGAVVGVSLISLREGIGAASIIKALTLKMLRATTQQGIAQWDNASLRVHTRMGALRLLGPVPSAHAKAAESFLYAVDLADEARHRLRRGRPARRRVDAGRRPRRAPRAARSRGLGRADRDPPARPLERRRPRPGALWLARRAPRRPAVAASPPWAISSSPPRRIAFAPA